MNLNQSWALRIDKKVYKELARFPKDRAGKFLEIIYSLQANPYTGDIQKLKGEENAWRRRIGDYRIFYDLKPNERIIEITWVERRTSKTY